MNKIFKKSKSDNRLKRIEYRGKYLRASRTGGVALRAQGKAAGINFTVNSKHGTRVSKRIAKGTNVGFQNGRFVLRGRYGKGPTKLNLSKSGVSVSSKTSVGTINWFKPKYSSAKIGGIQFRGDNALIIQGVVALFQIFYFFMTLTFKIGFWLLKTTFWLLKALFEAIILMFTKFKEHRLSRKQKAVEVLEVNWCKELQNQSNTRHKLILGHAGWSPGQLEREIENGDWLLQSTTQDFVFEVPADQMWQQAAGSIGMDVGDISGIGGQA